MMTTKLFSIVVIATTSLGGFLFGWFPLNNIKSFDEPTALTTMADQEANRAAESIAERVQSPRQAIQPAVARIEAVERTDHVKSDSDQAKIQWVTRTSLGVHVGRVSPQLRKHVQIPVGTGLLVEHVDRRTNPKNPLLKFDVIYQFDNQILVNSEQLGVLVSLRKAGDEVTLSVIRNGKKQDVRVKLMSKKIASNSAAFDAFYFFHGHAGKVEFQNCSVCHVAAHCEDPLSSSPHEFDNYWFFHGSDGPKEYQVCSKCHTQVVVPLNLSGAR